MTAVAKLPRAARCQRSAAVSIAQHMARARGKVCAQTLAEIVDMMALETFLTTVFEFARNHSAVSPKRKAASSRWRKRP